MSEAQQSSAELAASTEEARGQQLQAALVVQDDRIAEKLDAALEKYFERRKSTRFVDTNRIPFICDDIKGIHGTLDKMQTDFTWVKYLVMGIVGGIGILVVTFLAK